MRRGEGHIGVVSGSASAVSPCRDKGTVLTLSLPALAPRFGHPNRARSTGMLWVLLPAFGWIQNKPTLSESKPTFRIEFSSQRLVMAVPGGYFEYESVIHVQVHLLFYFSRAAVLFHVIMHSYDCSFREDLISSSLRSQSVHSSLTEDLSDRRSPCLHHPGAFGEVELKRFASLCIQGVCVSRLWKGGCEIRISAGFVTGITEAQSLPADSECVQ